MRVNIEAISGCAPCPLKPNCSFGEQALRVIDSNAPRADKVNAIQNYIAVAKKVNLSCPRSGELFP